MKRFLLITGLVVLFAAEILRVYFIMPFPGSQSADTVSFAYWLATHITWIRIVALAFIVFPALHYIKQGTKQTKIALPVILIFYAVVFFFINYRFEADKMFYQPKQKLFSEAAIDTTNKNSLVIGIAFNGEAKAYPIEVIGYHHQVMDTLAGEPVMVTYCTVCRTGRVFSPLVNGKRESFRLVGMDHFNAMFEDETTRSWWQQATGEAIAGPLKGISLKELPSKQLTLQSWLAEYPSSRIMQPDPSFKEKYAELKNYDKGTIESSLEKRDSASWQPKSWVVGVLHNNVAKAYDWNRLEKEKLINDSLQDLPLLVVLEKDKASFHVYSRNVNGTLFKFNLGKDDFITDENTSSTWDMAGVCVSGSMKGEKLQQLQSYQEFWHSWRTFHPNTLKYN
ncbi:DUF3179 domain-containing protein [Rhodocytophaga rosea]|uniref:DUF3179 domain-containing protein n=1 Tax=Rhodocytophaga rosea TaxID=2704465 RepID=A0A6C0GBF5_9BACT|nr:DUF3179 domain-containing (seleno)protein [Rhodocytophaga rosea]QHT65275.1 DUF3179 domain-containing protein [Rhodocytophaga rosea]